MLPTEFGKYKKQLEKLGADVLPRVIAESINVVAGFAHVQSIKNVRSRFTIRNAYTERSVRYYKASPKAKIAKINAVSGSVSDYMDEQDAGGVRRPKKGSKAPVATLLARGGSRSGRIKKRYQAGSFGTKQFVGKPRGGSRPSGVWERHARNKKIRMIRNLENETVEIKEKRWHRDAMGVYNREKFRAEFIRQAERELATLTK
jgi:hypothetical protein